MCYHARRAQRVLQGPRARNDYLAVDPAGARLQDHARARAEPVRPATRASAPTACSRSRRRARRLRAADLEPRRQRGEKSGNGLRIFARFLHATKRTRRTSFTVDTKGGVAGSSSRSTRAASRRARPWRWGARASAPPTCRAASTCPSCRRADPRRLALAALHGRVGRQSALRGVPAEGARRDAAASSSSSAARSRRTRSSRASRTCSWSCRARAIGSRVDLGARRGCHAGLGFVRVCGGERGGPARDREESDPRS
jgi:hypothetical protein